MEPLAERLALIARHVARLARASEEDGGASPVLRAVVSEFTRKAEKLSALTGTDALAAREIVIEVEEAGDCVKVAALADSAASENTRALAQVAHDAFCLLKHDWLNQRAP
jgi:hypothetical protein